MVSDSFIQEAPNGASCSIGQIWGGAFRYSKYSCNERGDSEEFESQIGRSGNGFRSVWIRSVHLAGGTREETDAEPAVIEKASTTKNLIYLGIIGVTRRVAPRLFIVKNQEFDQDADNC